MEYNTNFYTLTMHYVESVWKLYTKYDLVVQVTLIGPDDGSSMFKTSASDS